MQLKDRLRQVRHQAGLSIRELAQQTGLSYTYISGLENGRATPSFKTAHNIATACGMSLLDLMQPVDFAGEFSDEEPALPAGLRELAADPDYARELDEDWLALLRSIQLRGKQPQRKQDWLWLYLSLRKFFDE